MNGTIVRRALRSVAVGIAIAAVVDPAITSARATKPIVYVATLDSARDASLAERVSKAIDTRFTVVRSPIAGASGTVIVGDRLPAAGDEFPAPAFAVVSDTTEPSVSVDALDVPATAPANARVPVVAHVNVHSASGRSLDVVLRAGSVVADRVTRQFSRGDSTLLVPLSFVPTGLGASAVQVTATLTGSSRPAVADAAVVVRDRRWAVLFFDPRPSWTSTFVRRVIERDPRFVVTSRVITSRNVSTDAGRPPARLDDRAALSSFDAIVVGAPEGLSTGEVASLDAFMRRRGGSVVFLLDQRAPGAYDRLTGVSAWGSSGTSPMTLTLSRGDSTTLRTTDVAWPSQLPPGATVIAGDTRPVVWESSVGAGRLVVSGALDSWRFRDAAASGFDRFWRTVIAEAAGAAPPPLAVAVSPTIVTPGEMVDVSVVVRDAALHPALQAGSAVRASIAARLELAGTTLRLWPEGDVGRFTGAFRAPREPGVYRITLAGDSSSAEGSFIVAPDVRRVNPESRDLLVAWTAARHGHVLHAAEITGLPADLSAAIRPPSRATTWHPMRSAWWILPFALTLSGEWWLRRRRGLP